MSWHTTDHDHVRRVFVEGFSVRDIASPLLSMDSQTPAADVAAMMHDGTFEVMGVRENGLIQGYVDRSNLADGCCGDVMARFQREQVLTDSASLSDVVMGLSDAPRLFISFLGSIAGIVTRSDLQKPPVRMWLFGMITIVEMRFGSLIESHLPGDSWKEHLSAGRLSKAESLLEERRRRNQDLDLLDCLQFSDKGHIIARHEPIRRQTVFESRRKMEEVVKELEALRNNLAHSQDIIKCNWDIILRLTENLERVITARQSATP